MHVEDEAADRHGRERAVIHELGPVGVAALPGIEPERLQKVEGVTRRQAARRQNPPQRLRLGIGGAAPGQGRLQAVQEDELVVCRQSGVIGDVVGGADEAVEGEDRLAMARAHEARGDGEILVAMRFAGAGLSCRDHLTALRETCP